MKMNKSKQIALVILILMITTTAIVKIAEYRFESQANSEIQELLASAGQDKAVVTEKDLEDLPVSVRKWLEHSGVVGHEIPSIVHVHQKAEMRMSEEESWMPVEAEQYFTTSPAGFIWKARISAAPLLHISGRDQYRDGKGQMLIKPLSLLTVADASGSEIDQASMLRYLAETIWFPAAVLRDYITWTEVSEYQALATMVDGETKVTGLFTFSEEYDVIEFEAERYGEFDGQYRLETWVIPVHDHREFNGIRMPAQGDVTWRFDDGDFIWFRFEVLGVDYDPEGFTE